MQESEEIPIRGYLTLKTIESKVVYCLTFSQDLWPEPSGTSQRQGIPSASSLQWPNQAIYYHFGNSLEMRHPAKHQSRPLKDDWNILQLISAGIQAAKLLRDADAMTYMDQLYFQTRDWFNQELSSRVQILDTWLSRRAILLDAIAVQNERIFFN
jgi:hypothetical protein